MIYLLLGVAALALMLWPRRPLLKGDGWRVGAGVTSIIVGLWSATEARRRPQIRKVMAPPPKSELSLSEARAILGVGPEATLDEVRAAYARLIQMAHPDKGGTAGLAAQLNAARDRLIKRRG